MLLVTYALKNAFKNYSPLFEEIKQNSNVWWHYIDTSWIVNSPLTPDSFARKLFPHIEGTDRLFVVRIHKDYQGWLPEEAWKWINEKQF